MSYGEQRPHGIIFHHFHGKGHPQGQGSLSETELELMIEWLGQNRILNADEFLSRAQKGTLRENDLCLTFDDNLKCQYDVALPVLERHKIKAFWFVYTSPLKGKVERLELYRYFRTVGFKNIERFYQAFYKSMDSFTIEEAKRGLKKFNPKNYRKADIFFSDDDKEFRFIRDEVLGPQKYTQIMDDMIQNRGFNERGASQKLWMTATNLKDLDSKGHLVGLHSETHPTQMEKLPRVKQIKEYVDNYDRIADIGITPVAMSHPCNSYSYTVLDTLKFLGLKIGFRAYTDQKQFGEYEYPREDHAIVMRMMAQCK